MDGWLDEDLERLLELDDLQSVLASDVDGTFLQSKGSERTAQLICLYRKKKVG